MANLFQQQKKKGDIGEALVKNFLQAHRIDFKDVSNDKEYFSKDIDLFVGNTPIDVKYDTLFTHTGNLFIEYELAYDNGSKPGWFRFTEAEFIFYVDAASEKCLIFSMGDMRDYIEENKHCVKRVTCRDGFKDVRGYAVSAHSYRDSGRYYKVIDLKGTPSEFLF